MTIRVPAIRVPTGDLHAIYAGVARSHRATEEEQRLFADGLLAADLRGHPTQGIGLLAYLDDLFRQGAMRFGARLEALRETVATALCEGGANSGHVQGARAMALAIQKARRTGIGFVTVRNSGDCGMVANYSVQAADAGMIGLAMSTGPVLVAPWGGRDAAFCTNPLSLAMPAGAAEPIVIDMATSAGSMGGVVLAARDARLLDGKSVVDAEGLYTDDPRRVILDPMDRESRMAGALLPAGPKGFGMVLLVEILSALLSGERQWTGSGALAGDEPPPPGIDGRQSRADKTRGRRAHYAQSFLALDIAVFQDPAAFKAAADRMIQTLTTAPPAQGFAAVRLHGQGTRARSEDYRANGVPVRPEEWEKVAALKARLGL
ncbi:MAG: Ldh family oxidoreductase [Rhodospirillales bacterium]|nr:Ldh family oxidoreductase [Rhodospirillales bacterium]